MIYTGITRGKQLVLLVGQKKAMTVAVKGKQVEKRCSKLQKRLDSSPSNFDNCVAIKGDQRVMSH